MSDVRKRDSTEFDHIALRDRAELAEKSEASLREEIARLRVQVQLLDDAVGDARHHALQDARRAAVKAVMETGVSRGVALTEMPTCHKAKCFCDPDSSLNALVHLVLTRAADEVTRALILEYDEEAARLDHQRDAWDEGYMHVMKYGTGRNTRGMNPYLGVE